MRKMMHASHRPTLLGRSTAGPAAVLQRFKVDAPETLQGLSPAAVKAVSRLLKIETPTFADLQEGLRNPAMVRRLRTRHAAKEIKQFAIEHGIYQETLSDLGMRPSAFKRAAQLTGKPLPTLSDLLDWCGRRNSLRQEFSPQPGTTDAEIEAFAISKGHDNPALAYLNLGVRAVTVFRILYEKEVPGLHELERMVRGHPGKEERDAWLNAVTNCGDKTVFDIELAISNVPGLKRLPGSPPGPGDP
ncbi:MAG: hypothetical protein PHV13_05320 [Candidatus ainarchaeum sp.]|nr:hypothetical protein [Candidatus ainarchaeum sp.]